MLLGSAALGLIGAFMPWEKASNSIASTTQSPSDSGAVVILLALLGLVVWLAFQCRSKALGKGALIGLAAVAAIMTIFALAKFGVISSDQDKANQAASSATGGLGSSLGSDYSEFTSQFTSQVKVTVAAGAGLLLWCLACIGVWAGTFLSRKAP